MTIDYRGLFLTDTDIQNHFEAYEKDIERYMATYLLLQSSDVHLAPEVKEKIFGTFLLFKNESTINYLFTKPFWTILDIRNVIRLLWTQTKKKSQIRSRMKSGQGVKKSRRQILIDIITNMTDHHIERSILRHSYDAWREVIDFLHIPERNFPDYDPKTGHSSLCKTIMDGQWEPTPFIKRMRSINQENAKEILNEFPTEFHYLRKKIKFTPKIAKAYLANADIKNILRWYDELWSSETISLIEKRILNYPDMIHHPFSLYFDLLLSKRDLMKKKLYDNLIQRTDQLTSRFNLPMMSPALIAVDQSSSMSSEQVKIGTVIASQVGNQLDADLVYFYGGDDRKAKAEYEDIPLGTKASLNMIDKHPPIGFTPVAQILLRYWTPEKGLVKDQKNLQSLILITDEGENTKYKDMRLSDALSEYRNAIGHNIEVMIIRVRSNESYIFNSLKIKNFPVIRYDIDSLQHIESLFALISANTPAFLEDQDQLRDRIYSSDKKTQTYLDAETDLKKYKQTRDKIFASVIKGTCINCGANLSSESVTRFRFGNTITCENCDFSLAPTLFGNHPH